MEFTVQYDQQELCVKGHNNDKTRRNMLDV